MRAPIGVRGGGDPERRLWVLFIPKGRAREMVLAGIADHSEASHAPRVLSWGAGGALLVY